MKTLIAAFIACLVAASGLIVGGPAVAAGIAGMPVAGGVIGHAAKTNAHDKDFMITRSAPPPASVLSSVIIERVVLDSSGAHKDAVIKACEGYSGAAYFDIRPDQLANKSGGYIRTYLIQFQCYR